MKFVETRQYGSLGYAVHVVIKSAILGYLATVVAGCGGKTVLDSQDDLNGATSEAYVLSVSYALQPFEPFVFDARIDRNYVSQQLSMNLQPLSEFDRSTAVGQSTSGGPFPLQELGLYEADFALVISADAVPFFPGGDAHLDFHMQAEEPTCGSISGELTFASEGVPRDMAGSTYAMSPARHPDARIQPLIDCEGNRAEPL